VIEALQPLAAIPGVSLVMFLTQDGVPISIPGSASRAHGADAGSGDELDERTRDEALAAVAAHWHSELGRAVGPLSWSPPSRAVLKTARGTLVLHETRGALLLVLLARGVDSEEVRLAMGGTVARIERTLRGTNEEETALAEELGSVDEPPAPLSSRRERSSPDDQLSELRDSPQQLHPSGN
jgi:predicted regulator of Ras-like GTPase activity (Roadblock/LC7/MglB family)